MLNMTYEFVMIDKYDIITNWMFTLSNVYLIKILNIINTSG